MSKGNRLAIFVTVLVASLSLTSLVVAQSVSTIVGTSGAVVAVAPPASVELNAYQSDTEIRVFAEQSVNLPQALALNISQPGTYADAANLTPGTLAIGTSVNSFLVHFDTIIVSGTTLSGTVRFSTQILGLIVMDGNLDGTDVLLGAPGTVYPVPGLVNRGLELSQAGNDRITLGCDTLDLQLTAFETFDHIRVITSDAPCPPATATPTATATLPPPSTATSTATASPSPTLPPGASTVVHSSLADFTGCGPNTNVSIANAAGGELRLVAVLEDYFDSPGIDFTRWITGQLYDYGGAFPPVVANGILSVNASYLRSAAAMSQPTRVFEARARLRVPPANTAWGDIGFGRQNYPGMPDPIGHNRLFITNDANQVIANARNGEDPVNNVTMTGVDPADWHIYRIVWGQTSTDYYIDGVYRSTDTQPSTYNPYVWLYTLNPGGTVEIDWTRVDYYLDTTGVFQSCAVDAGQTASWGNLSWTGSLPPGTSVSFETRSSADGTNWSAWSAPFSDPSAPIASPANRYLQYRVSFSSSDPTASPQVDEVSVVVLGAGGPTPTATATSTSVPPTATNTPLPPTATNTPLPTATNTPLPPTATSTPLPTATNTPLPPTATNTPLPPTATSTPLPTATNTPLPPTATSTPLPPTATSTPLPTAAPQTLSVRVSASNDDAEEQISGGDDDDSGAGYMYLDSSDLELVTDGSTAQTVGMRFRNVTIPTGARVVSAYIEFETDETGSGTTALVFAGEAADDASAFTTSRYNITRRSLTNNRVSWPNVPAWNSVNERHRTPDLAPVVQEIVSRSGWSSGNALVIVVTGTGRRTAESYDGEPGAAPRLVVEYVAAGGPTATPSPTSTPVPTATPTSAPAVALYFSTKGNDSVPGTGGSADDADIYAWTGSSFSRLIDASAIGLPSNANVDGLRVVDADTFYVSFDRDGGVSVPGLGTVQDEDIVLYDAGVWSLFFDGSDVGLSGSNGEDVDAFEFLPDGSLLVSTVDSPSVSGLSGVRDEDLIRCVGSFGAATVCTWSLYFDGSAVGLGSSSEDVRGLAVAGSGDIFLTTDGDFSVAGLSGRDEDVFVCRSPLRTSGVVTGCTGFSMYFDGSAYGFTADLDAIDLP